MRNRVTSSSLLVTDAEHHTPLMNAALDGDTNIVRAFLSAGVEINEQNINGRTALMLAVINRHLETVKMLLSEGADTNFRSSDGATALSLAASGGDGAMMSALMNHRADVRAESTRANAPAAKLAARNVHQGVTKLFQKLATRTWVRQ